jgi:hypothetical protein
MTKEPYLLWLPPEQTPQGMRPGAYQETVSDNYRRVLLADGAIDVSDDDTHRRAYAREVDASYSVTS